MARIMARTGKQRKSEAVDLDTILEGYYDAIAQAGRSETTVEWYKTHLYVLRKRLEMTSLAQWRAEAVVKVMATMVREQYSKSYMYNLYRTAKHFDKYLVTWGYVEAGGVSKLLAPPPKPNPEIFPLYPHQVTVMFEMVEKFSRNPLRDKAILSVDLLRNHAKAAEIEE